MTTVFALWVRELTGSCNGHLSQVFYTLRDQSNGAKFMHEDGPLVSTPGPHRHCLPLLASKSQHL